VESLAELSDALLSSHADDSLDVLLDATDLAIEIAGMRTRLTRTQFRLLEHLSVKRGCWVTHARRRNSTLQPETYGTNCASRRTAHMRPPPTCLTKVSSQ
jgi:hypothetical protein